MTTFDLSLLWRIIYVQIMMFAFHVDAGNIFMDWDLIMSFSTAIKERISAKVHIGYCNNSIIIKSLKRELSNPYFFTENGKEESWRLIEGCSEPLYPRIYPYRGLSNPRMGKSKDGVRIIPGCIHDSPYASRGSKIEILTGHRSQGQRRNHQVSEEEQI